MSLKVSLIICTKDRPFDLTRLFQSITNQAEEILEIIVVDGSDKPVKEVVDQFKDSLPLQYYTLRPPGLTRQRNFGISKLSVQAQWVGFLDDDLELDSNCIVNLKKTILANDDVWGIGLKINNQPNPGRSFIKELMLLDQFPGGRVTLSGAAAAIRPYNKSIEVDWLYGGATFWKKEVLSLYKFDEWFSGVGYCEDLDFSYRVSRDHKLMVCAEAGCLHHHRYPSAEKMFSMGEWVVVAWWYFARIKNSFKRLYVLWGIANLLIINLTYFFLNQDKGRLSFFRGGLSGLRIIFSNKVVNTVGFQK